MTRVLLTGGSSGVGKAAALQLAQGGASLVLGCRDMQKGQEVAAWIAQQTGGAAPDVLLLDTGIQKSIRDFAATFRQRYDRLDVLVNNAGVSLPIRQTSVDGVDLTFATNVLGYHLLTRELLDLLKASGSARIVNVASTFAGDLDVDDLQFKRRPYTGVAAYRQSKQANRMLTWALVRRLEGTKVTAHAVSPGLIWTGLYRELKGTYKWRLRVISLLFGHTVEEGGDALTRLATNPEFAGVSGKLFELRKELQCQFRNEALEEKLWSVCDDLVAAR